MITAKEARQALKTIAQYCNERYNYEHRRDCYNCKIKDVCDACEMQSSPFIEIGEILEKEYKEKHKFAWQWCFK